MEMTPEQFGHFLQVMKETMGAQHSGGGDANGAKNHGKLIARYVRSETFSGEQAK